MALRTLSPLSAITNQNILKLIQCKIVRHPTNSPGELEPDLKGLRVVVESTCHPGTNAMYTKGFSPIAGAGIVALALSTASIFLGCGPNNKVQQIQNGFDDVESHAQEIEDAAQETVN